MLPTSGHSSKTRLFALVLVRETRKFSVNLCHANAFLQFLCVSSYKYDVLVLGSPGYPASNKECSALPRMKQYFESFEGSQGH